MNNCLIVGLTGQTGAGKTTVCSYLRQCGIAVIDADIVAREQMNNNAELLSVLSREFSPDIVTKSGSLDRKKLAQLAFVDEKSVNKLNKLCHPIIIKAINEKIAELKKDNNIIVLDAPALFESGADKICDFIVAVIAPENVRLDRLVKRDNLTPSEAIKRIRIQKNDLFYTSKASYVIINDGDVDKLLESARKLYERLKEELFLNEKEN